MGCTHSMLMVARIKFVVSECGGHHAAGTALPRRHAARSLPRHGRVHVSDLEHSFADQQRAREHALSG
jgi:hypothetical protein